MEKNINLSTGSVTFNFTDTDGEVFASFKLNPTDPRLLKKCKNLADFFFSMAENRPSDVDYEELVEEKFSEFLGYDCKQQLFGRVAATAILKDGRIFAAHVLDALIANVGSEIKKRRAANVARYVSKYEK